MLENLSMYRRKILTIGNCRLMFFIFSKNNFTATIRRVKNPKKPLKGLISLEKIK